MFLRNLSYTARKTLIPVFIMLTRQLETSPQRRQSILPNFFRSRPRGQHDSTNRDSPPPTTALLPILDNHPFPFPGLADHRRRPAAITFTTTTTIQRSHSHSALTQMLRRRRSAGGLPTHHTPNPQSPPLPHHPQTTISAASNPSSRPSHRIRLVPHLDSRRSLKFDPIARDVREGDTPLRIGRFTDRSGLGIANAPGSNKLAFKSKVVSRAHAEIWAETSGKFFIRDTKSSSGTFLNHVRMSPANSESRPFELKDGDVLQLGVDYQGGTEDIYKCVKIKVEVNREWQATPNAFKFVPFSYLPRLLSEPLLPSTNAIKQLRTLTSAVNQPGVSTNKKISAKSAMADCCICVFLPPRQCST